MHGVSKTRKHVPRNSWRAPAAQCFLHPRNRVGPKAAHPDSLQDHHQAPHLPSHRCFHCEFSVAVPVAVAFAVEGGEAC